ncbi:Polysialic acid transport ATP-binding protein KpsT [Aliiroseovarius pelagivivens]|uniref:Polysialic acid transport ATP-binding protein KpsT n=1 Tax=Aliiroseovarius pelagivivens TaxID=1639690 RepID=A0A2R8AS55_9RHOB|nr:ABC transporter ATP-binding protein [Aliiroseovarius pelagivivens]SPF78694.1 Polysialic acid transport ATP-binding protein KpsT [Aliiroseovarius pelagivivens]
MIRIRNLRKAYRMQGQTKVVADNISVKFEPGKVIGLLGRNGAGKSSLLRMVAGTMRQDGGSIDIDGTVSWPVGFAGSFHKDLTGAQNTKFLARIYGVDTEELREYVEDFAELGQQFYLPVRTYSSGMRSRLAFGLSMGIKFDVYLVDEVTSVGDAAFRKKSMRVFRDRMESSGALLVTHNLRVISNVCDAACILDEGRLTYYDDVEEAVALHREMTA